MSDNNAELATLVGSRICHDLISPIGAITNGLELLELTGAMQGPELDLISESVTSANARIRFFRIAYGAAGEQMMGRPEILPVLDGINRSGRLRFEWTPPGALPRAEVRLAFLAMQCCESAMPLGGTVRAACDGGAWTVTAEAERLKQDDGLWSRLGADKAAPGLTPAQVQFALFPAAAAELGRDISFENGGNRLVLRF